MLNVRSAVKRGIRVISMATLALAWASAPAAAKMPYFGVTITPSEPIAGEPIVVAVRMWQDPAHRIPARFEAVTLDRLLVVRPDAPGRPEIAVSPRYQPDRGEYRATVIIPSAGAWKLVAFPDRTAWSSPRVPPGYPDTIALVIRSEGAAAQTPVDLAALGSRSDTDQPGNSRGVFLLGALLVFAVLTQRYIHPRAR
jgi:hypothetical protein